MNPLGNTQPIAAQPSNAFNTPIKQTKQIQEISPIFSESPSKPKTKIADFEICGFVGEGAYAKVYLVKHKVTSKMYAAKVIDKDNVRLEGNHAQVRTERTIMSKLLHPNIIKLWWSFTDEKRLYFVLEYASHGELSHLLRTQGPLQFDLAQHYSAEIVNCLEYLHQVGIVHRDIKPENLLLDDNWHIKLGDFGSAKELEFYDNNKARRNTLVGTAEYVCPEVLLGKPSGSAADLWALGCIIFQFFAGNPPFKGSNEEMFTSILRGEFIFPDDFPDIAKDLCLRLIRLEPDKRLGSGKHGTPFSMEALKSHAFFKGIDFTNLHTHPVPIAVSLDSKRSNSPQRSEDQQFEKKEIKQGILKKKCGPFFYYDRVLKLNNEPRLTYYEKSGSSEQYKGDIILSKLVIAVKESVKKFKVATPNREYFFKGTMDDVDQWVKAINDTIKDYCL